MGYNFIVTIFRRHIKQLAISKKTSTLLSLENYNNNKPVISHKWGRLGGYAAFHDGETIERLFWTNIGGTTDGKKIKKINKVVGNKYG